MIDFDEHMARRVEATYSTPDMVEQRRATRALLAVDPGERVLDIGSGPGLLAAELAAEAGPDGAVHGLDASQSMVDMAERRAPAPRPAPGRLPPGGPPPPPLPPPRPPPPPPPPGGGRPPARPPPPP